LLINVLFHQNKKDSVVGIRLKDYMQEARPENARRIEKIAGTFLERLRHGDGQSIIEPIAGDLTPFQVEALNKKLEKNSSKQIVIKRVLAGKDPEPCLWEAECFSSSGDKLRFQFCKCEEGVRLCNVF
jgi:hypothetical protein